MSSGMNFNSRPRAKTLRRMEIQKALGLPQTGKRIKHKDGTILHPTKGRRIQDETFDDDDYQTEKQKANSQRITEFWQNVFHKIDQELVERETEVFNRSKEYYAKIGAQMENDNASE